MLDQTTAPHFRSLQSQTQSALRSSQLGFFESIHPEIQVISTSVPTQQVDHFPQFPVSNVVGTRTANRTDFLVHQPF